MSASDEKFCMKSLFDQHTSMHDNWHSASAVERSCYECDTMNEKSVDKYVNRNENYVQFE